MKNRSDVKPANQQIRPLEESLPIQLLRVHDQVMAYFRPMLNRFGMTDQQWRVLRAIASGVTDVGELADATHIQPASLSRMMVTLQKRGWTTREISSSDRRQRTLTMTEEGWVLFHSAAKETETIYEALQDDLGETHAQLLLALRATTKQIDAS